MSLYDDNFETETSVTELKHCILDIDGVEHEIIMDIDVRYDLHRNILGINTRYWKHYYYDVNKGFDKRAEGETTSTMTNLVYDVFKKYAKLIEEENNA